MNSDNLKQPVISSMYFTEDSYAVLSHCAHVNQEMFVLVNRVVSVHAKAQVANELLAKEWTIACLHVPYARSDFQPLHFSFVLYHFSYPKQSHACIWVMYILLGGVLRKPGGIHCIQLWRLTANENHLYSLAMNVVCSVPIPYSKLVTFKQQLHGCQYNYSYALSVSVIPSLLHFHFILYMFNCDCPSDGLQVLRSVSMLDSAPLCS